MEYSECQERELVGADFIEELPLCVPSHVKEHNQTCRETSIKEELEGAHLRVPHPEEFSSDQVVSGEYRIQNEVEDG